MHTSIIIITFTVFSQGTYGEMKLVQANLEKDEPNNGN